MNILRVLFVIDSLRKGGIKTSLINLLNCYDFKNDTVELLSFHDVTESLPELPNHVKIIRTTKLLNLVSSTSDELRYHKFQFIIRKFLALLCKLFGSNIVYKCIFLTVKSVKGYDVAISFTNNVGNRSLYYGSNKFVIEKVVSKKKIAWIHADFEKMGLTTKKDCAEYYYFDKVVAVSSDIKKKFLKYNPEMKSKVSVIYNYINEKKLDNLSNAIIDEKFNIDILNFITVTRLDENKDPLKIIEISKALKKQKHIFIWRIIGDGPLYNKLCELIKESKLDDVIKLYGYKLNPYPFIKQSDLYISTSKSEGYSLSVVESLYLKVPVLCGYYDSVYEVLDENNGWIIENKLEKYIDILDCFLQNKNIVREKSKKISMLHENKDISYKFYEVLYE